MAFEDLTGKQFHQLFVECRYGSPGQFRKSMWYCRCTCNEHVVVSATNLKTGNTKSCGCTRYIRTPRTDIVGKHYEMLEVLKCLPGSKALCRCVCGKEIIVEVHNLMTGNTKSCGCRLARFIMHNMINLTGRIFGELTVMARYIDANKKKKQKWLCHCSCGRYTIVDHQKLISGHTKSCGCKKNSFPESMIVHYLRTHNISHETEFKFKDLVSYTGLPLRFDFKIDTMDGYFLIEYQGQQHYLNHDDFGKQQREVTDKMKKKYCEKNKIELAEIKYDENLIESLEKILKDHNVLYDNPVPSP